MISAAGGLNTVAAQSSPLRDPCPMPRQGLQSDVVDLEIVQKDITRLTLCVERAQLLDRLNVLVEENADTIQTSLQDEINTIGNSIDFQPMIPPSMPSRSSSNGANQQQSPVMPQPQWRVRNISGVQGNLSATLIGSNNMMKTVNVGDTIDGNVTVKSIGLRGVVLSSGRQDIPLEWSER